MPIRLHPRSRTGLLLALVTLGVALDPGVTAGQWPPAQAPPPPTPRILWHVEGNGWGRPAADERHAYFLGRHELVARSAADGALRWRATLSPVADLPWGTRVVLDGSHVMAGDYDVFAFDGDTGAPRWTYAPVDGHAPGTFIGDVSDGVLYTGSGGGRLHAVDTRTGRARWVARLSGEAAVTVHPPVVAGSLVIASFTRFVAPREGGVVALDRATGAPRWRADLPVTDDPTLDRFASGPAVVAGDRVLAASGDGFIHLFDVGTGASRGALPRADLARRPDAIASPTRDVRPLVTDGRIVVAGSLTGVVAALDVIDGTLRWDYAHPLHGSVLEDLSRDADTVYIPFVEGQLLALDAGSGRERWMTAPGRGFHWAPARHGGRLFAAATTGFYALEEARMQGEEEPR